MLFSKPKPKDWDIRTYLIAQKARVETRLAQLPITAGKPTIALEAMNYALSMKGKRFRPLLTLATADIYQASDKPEVLDAAVAIECIHTASLLFDDLPCMDDATLRRGQKTAHLLYGEAQAVLAGMSLIAEANLLLTGDAKGRKAQLARQLECVSLLNASFSSDGLSGGQSDDLLNKTHLEMSEIEYIHAKKTGALFIATTEIAAVLCGATADERHRLRSFAKNLGLAFQIQDDLLDLVDSETTGKDQGKDAGKTTFVNLMGTEKSTHLYNELIEVALENLKPFGRAAHHLVELSRVIQSRKF